MFQDKWNSLEQINKISKRCYFCSRPKLCFAGNYGFIQPMIVSYILPLLVTTSSSPCSHVAVQILLFLFNLLIVLVHILFLFTSCCSCSHFLVPLLVQRRSDLISFVSHLFTFVLWSLWTFCSWGWSIWAFLAFVSFVTVGARRWTRIYWSVIDRVKESISSHDLGVSTSCWVVSITTRVKASIEPIVAEDPPGVGVQTVFYQYRLCHGFCQGKIVVPGSIALLDKPLISASVFW